MCMLISESRCKARKAHSCMAYEYLNGFGVELELTYAEKRAIVRAKLNGGKIQPGEEYIRQFMDWDGEKGTYKAIPAIHDICIKYDVFDGC